MILLACACRPAAPVEDPRGSRPYLSAADPGFKGDHEQALRAMFRSSLGKAGKSNALEGVLRLMIGHELGHAFERAHGPLEGIDSEDFADLFSLNLIAEGYSVHPSPYLPTEEYTTIMNAFLANVPADAHLGKGGVAEVRRRRDLYSCVHYGIVANYAHSDPFAYYAESDLIPPQDVALVERKATFAGQSRQDWLADQARRHIMALAYLKARESVLPPAMLERCVAIERRFRAYLVTALANPERTRQTLAEAGVFSWDEMSIAFEYAKPETEGAQLVFATATPSLPGTAPGISYLPWLAVKFGWFPDKSASGLVRLEYCGIGNVNAYLDMSGDKIILTLCYEIGENILAHPELYPRGDPELYKPMNDYAERNFPEMMRRTEEMMSNAK